MQKIRYINLRGETLEFGARPPLILASVKGLGQTEAALSGTKAAYQSGERITRIQRAARVVDLQFTLIPTQQTRAGMYAERMRVSTILSAARCMDADGNMGRLIYENDAGSWWTYAVPEGEGAQYGTRLQSILPGGKIAFRSGSAYWRSTEEYEARLEMGEGGFRLPFSFPIRFGTGAFSAQAVNGGGTDAPVRIVIYGSGETPTIRNDTTGAQVIIERTIATGERLEIDTNPESLKCVHVHADGTSEDAWGYLNAASAIADFALAPGENALSYIPSQTASGSRVKIYWNAQFEGV